MAIHEAAEAGDLSAVNTLQADGTDPIASDEDGATPLGGAAEEGSRRWPLCIAKPSARDTLRLSRTWPCWSPHVLRHAMAHRSRRPVVLHPGDVRR